MCPPLVMLTLMSALNAVGRMELQPTTGSVNYNIKLGLMMPNEDPYLKHKMGFSTSASAVTIALDRVRREQLLPGAHFS